MKSWRFTGHQWVADDRPLWTRVRRWLACVGECEKADGRLDLSGKILPIGFFGHKVNLFRTATDVPGPPLFTGFVPGTLAITAHTSLGLVTIILKRFGLGIQTVAISNGLINHTYFVEPPTPIRKDIESRAVA